MIYLQGNQLARRFGAETLFENIHIEIHDTSRIALVGRNGAGKSTLLKILTGEETPDSGTISTMKGTKIGYLAQNTGLNSERTIWEEMLSAFNHLIIMEENMKNIESQLGDTSIQANQTLYEKKLDEYATLQHQFKEQNGYGYESEMRSVLHGFQFDSSFYDRVVETLSGGQKTRLALAKLLLEQPQILILDEPTNHLDIETLSWLEGYLHNYRGSLLIVSHDRYFLDKVVNEVYELSRGEATHFTGNYSRYMKLKEEKLEAEWKQFEKQQVEIKQLETFVAKNLVRASTTKRAQSRRKKLEKMDRLDKPQGDEKSANFLFNIEKESGNIVLQLEDAAVGYDSHTLSAPITIDLRKKNAVALVGPNGVGKSTLLKSIIGEIPFVKGEVHFGTNVDIGYYDQEQTKLHSTKTVLEELWSEHTTTPEKEIRNVLGSFLFSGDDVSKTVPLLSGGEKARLALAKLAMDERNFLILDEPTNHLDIDSKEVLENALIDYEGTLFFVSHDRYFINRVATQIIELSEDGSQLYLGDYDYYIEKKEEEEQRTSLLAEETYQKADISNSEGKLSFQQSKEQQKVTRSIERKITEIEKSLEIIEKNIEEVHAQMTLPEISDNHSELVQMSATLEQYEAKQEALLEEWENQSLLLEEYQI